MNRSAVNFSPSNLDVERIRHDLPEIEVVYLPTVDSTNSWALEHLRDRSTGSVLVVTDQQTAGRGQRQNSWFADSCSLTFSLVTELPKHQSRFDPLISLSVAVWICQVLEAAVEAEGQTSRRIQIKWPNDILIDGKKAGGILIESLVGETEKQVIGIGLNINQAEFDFDASSAVLPISMRQAFQRTFERTELLVRIVSAIQHGLNRGQSDEEMLASFSNRDFLLGRSVVVQMGDTRVVGTCSGVNERGGLLVETEQETVTVFSGVIQSIG